MDGSGFADVEGIFVVWSGGGWWRIRRRQWKSVGEDGLREKSR